MAYTTFKGFSSSYWKGLTLHCDNQFTIRLVENPIFMQEPSMLKYIFISQGKVLQGEIKMKQVKIEDQIADLFTKCLGVSKFDSETTWHGEESRH